jgi:hypothetical protein
MEGGDEDMEIDVTMQHDDESIRMKSDQFMEDKRKLDYEQVPNQKPLLIQKTSAPIEHVSNSLPIKTKLVQLV